jgi:hypothetical protein
MDTVTMTRARAGLAIVVACLLIAGCIAVVPVLRREREKQRDHTHRVCLFNEASGVPPYFVSTDGAARAVRELGADPSDEAEQMLFALASRQPEIPAIYGQPDAIRELKRRRSSGLPEFLAGIINTKTLIDSRKEAAQALQGLPCDAACTTTLLDYLSRIDGGELNVEDTGPSSPPSGLDAIVKPRIVAEQQEIYDLIYSELLRDAETTNRVLAHAYGLGTATPQGFAISFAAKANSQEFCPSLIQSEQQLKMANSNRSTRESLEDAMATLKCRRD